MKSNLVHLVISECSKKAITVAEFARRMGIGEKSAYNGYFNATLKRTHNYRVSTILALSEALETDPIVIFNACLADRKEWLKNG